MKNEKTRGTMLTSSAVILCLATFAAGFVSGSVVAEHRSGGSVTAPVADTAPVSSPVVSNEQGQAEHIRHLREEALKSPDNADLWTNLGNACYDAGDPDGAIEAYTHSLSLVPGNADVRTDMGNMYRMKGMPEQAVACYEQAIADHPGHRNAVFNKGVTLMLDLEQPEQAVAFWNSVLAAQPDFTLSSGIQLRQAMPEVVSDAAIQLEAHGRKDAALRAYGEALKIDDSYAPALVHRAWLLENLGRADEAQPLWKRVVELYPDATDPAGNPVRDRIKK